MSRRVPGSHPAPSPRIRSPSPARRSADGTVERVPVLFVRPASEGRYPVVIVLHGTGGSKEGVKSWLNDFAHRGIMGVAIDARYHGDRAGGTKGSAAYVAAITAGVACPAGARWSIRSTTTPSGTCGG